jgi:hypothetical protein
MGADELIDAYLYELRSALHASGDERDRVVAEVEDHLWESWERFVAAGVESHEAARLAIARFGAASEVAAGFPEETIARRFAQIYFGAAVLFGSLLVTIGLAAMLTLPVHAALGADFLFGPDARWEAPARFCTERGTSGANCQEAWDNFFVFRMLGVGALATVVGGAIVAAHVLGGRFAFGGISRRTLVTGAWLFAIAGLLFLAGGTLKYTFGPESGWNTWLPAGIAALMMSGGYVLFLRSRRLREDVVTA